MKKSVWGLMAGAVFAARIVSAADDAPEPKPTFTKDVLPIMQKNCQECHRPAGLNLGGTIAPMALMNYEDVRPWAKSIAKSVKNRTMPPWHATADFHGVFRNERTLTEKEIATVVAWVNSGATQGDAKDAPAPIEWPKTDWVIGTPDLVLTLDKPFEVKDEVEDLNIDLVTQITEEQLPEDRFVTAFEFKPGSDVVHHIIGFTMTPMGNGKQEFSMLGGMAPGTAPESMPEGYGVLLRKGSKFDFQMHYHKDPGPGTGRVDRSSVALKFAPKDAKITRLYVEAVGEPGKLRVPAGDENYRITASRTFPRDIKVWSYLPHMHLRGTYAKYVANLPDGKQETMLEVPKWDFNWQTSYRYKEPRLLPAGTRLDVTLGYNNSTSNPANPDPTKEVRWGAPTTDEMNLGWMTWAYVQPGPNDKPPQPIGGRNIE